MKSLDTYILRQCLGPLGLILIVTTTIVWMTQTLQRIDIIVEYGQGFWVFIYLSLLIIPSLLAVIVPFALFGAIVFALHRLHSDSEIAVMFAAGVSRWRIATPVFAISIFVALATLYINIDLMPRSYRVLKQEVANIRADFATTLLRSGEFINASDGFTIYVNETRPGNQFVGLLINDYRDSDNRETYMAQRAILQETDDGPLLVLKNGNIQRAAKYSGKVDIIRFEDWAVNISVMSNGPASFQLELTERYLGELLRPDMSNAYDRANAGKLIAEGHGRLASPLYVFAYVLTSLFALIGGAYTRRSYFIRIAAAGAVIFGIRVLGFVTQGMAGTSGEIWMIYAPPLVLAGIAAFLLFAPRQWRTLPKRETA